MIALTTVDNTPLTIMCIDVSLPLIDMIEIENRFLDGSLQIQTVGKPLKTIMLEVLVNEINAVKINEIECSKETVLFIRDKKEYKCIIRHPIKWEKREMYIGQNTKYSGEIELVIMD